MFDPLVTDRHGRVIGVHSLPASQPEESKAGRVWRHRQGLARTGEMRLQASLRNEFSAFHVDSASSPRR
jgi:hypothetical protein